MAPAPAPNAMPSTSAAPDPQLEALSQLVHLRAEIFANPTSIEGASGVRKQTLDTTKYLFDDSIKNEATSLSTLAQLLNNIRGDDLSGDITTRSKSSAAKAKGKGKATAAILSNPIFKPTPLDELYLDPAASDNATREQNSLTQQMIWEQLNLKIGKVLDIYREIVQDGAASDEDGQADGGDSDDFDSDGDVDGDEDMLLDVDEDAEEYMDGLDEDEDDDLDEDELEEDEDGLLDDEDDEDDDDGPTPSTSKPYFAKLRDASSPAEDEDQEDDDDDDEELADVLEDPKKSILKANGKGKGKTSGKGGARQEEPATAAGSSSVDAGFFSLADFHFQMRAGEDEMRRYMRIGKSKSASDLQDRIESLGGLDGGADEDEDEDVDYFAPAGRPGDSEEEGGDDDNEEEEEEPEEEELRPEDMTYADFWNTPKTLYGGVPGSKQKGQDEAKAKAGRKGKGAADTKEAVNPDSIVKGRDPKRRVSFHDDVKVQEFESGKTNKSAVAALVKKFGMKEALKRLGSGELDDEDVEGYDIPGLDGDEEDAEEDGDEDMDAENAEVDDEDMEDDNESVGSSEGDDLEQRTMRRIQTDLLEDDDDEQTSSTLDKKGNKTAQSRYEQRMAALSEQIAELEAENVAEKDWTMRGESNSRARPVNSLLEEDLEFDQVAKVVPVVTEETTQTLEEKIKKRILDDQFDDVIRRRLHEPAAYLPSRLLDIKDTQGDRSLAEIYADEYSTERTRLNGGEAQVAEVDAKLAKEHDLIASIFDEVCNKLDALSNAHFTPKNAQTTITTVSNLPSISLENALPTAQSTSTLLAPEEVYAPTQNGALTSKSEMTPSQKKAARAKARKARATTQKSIQKYGGKTSSRKDQKERAMNSLIGKRGVTVIGKGKAAKSALTGKDRKDRDAGATHTGSSLKL